MKMFISAAILLLSPLAILAAPCAPGTLESYFNLGSTGCELGNSLFTNFRLGQVPPFPTMDPMVVNVTPGGAALQPELLFTPNYSAGPGQIFGLLFQFVVTGALTSVSLQFNSPTTSGDGHAYAFVDVCAGGLYSPYAPFDCATGLLPYLLGHAGGLGSDKLQDSMTLPNASFYDVSLHLYLDNQDGRSGSASLNSANIAFNTVPEPAVTPLILAGLAAIGFRRWKHSGDKSRLKNPRTD